MLLYVSTETVGLLGTGAQHGHLHFHSAPELSFFMLKCCFTSTEELSFFMLKCCFTSTETVGLLRTGAQHGHLDFHTAPELSQDVPDRHFFGFLFQLARTFQPSPLRPVGLFLTSLITVQVDDKKCKGLETDRTIITLSFTVPAKLCIDVSLFVYD